MEQNKTGKYLKYAIGEIFLVMIGILLALQINNWNENRRGTTLEIDILKEVKNGLITDLEDAKFNLNSQEETYASQDLIINWLESNLAYNDSLS